MFWNRVADGMAEKTVMIKISHYCLKCERYTCFVDFYNKVYIMYNKVYIMPRNTKNCEVIAKTNTVIRCYWNRCGTNGLFCIIRSLRTIALREGKLL